MADVAEWSSFYVIVGSAAGALIGPQFVVLTLIAGRPALRAPEAGAAVATPTIVHFGVVLFLSALVSVPWHAIGTVSVVWGLAGLSGIAYDVAVARRMRAQTVYEPVFEDWLSNVLLPLGAHSMLSGSAYMAHLHLRPALIVLGAATLLLLFVSIHNAWDAVSYHVFVNKDGEGEAKGISLKRPSGAGSMKTRVGRAWDLQGRISSNTQGKPSSSQGQAVGGARRATAGF